MKKIRSLDSLNYIDIEVSEMTDEEVSGLGYQLRSSTGEFSLPKRQRTQENVNDMGELTIKGANVLAKNILKKSPDIKDFKIIPNPDGYDLYALQ